MRKKMKKRKTGRGERRKTVGNKGWRKTRRERSYHCRPVKIREGGKRKSLPSIRKMSWAGRTPNGMLIHPHFSVGRKGMCNFCPSFDFLF